MIHEHEEATRKETFLFTVFTDGHHFVHVQVPGWILSGSGNSILCFHVELLAYPFERCQVV